MQIDVTERIATAKRLTSEWAERSGYKNPIPDAAEPLSKRANDVRRILAVANFGCQERHVHALMEALLDERLPMPKREVGADYLSREPFVIGSVLVPVNFDERSGLVVKLSQAGNAGLRKSNGELHNNHFQQHSVRPATDEEIDDYFAEFFGLRTNAADEPQIAGEAVADDALEPNEPTF